MNDGRPIFDQDLQPDVDPMVEEAPPPVVREQPDVIGNRLKFSQSYKEEPLFEGQAKLYPDSVKIVGERYQIFDASRPEDMDEYSKIWMSHRQAGRFIMTSDEHMQWNEQKGTWCIMLRVQERMFKTIKTSDLNPADL